MIQKTYITGYKHYIFRKFSNERRSFVSIEVVTICCLLLIQRMHFIIINTFLHLTTIKHYELL